MAICSLSPVSCRPLVLLCSRHSARALPESEIGSEQGISPEHEHSSAEILCSAVTMPKFEAAEAIVRLLLLEAVSRAEYPGDHDGADDQQQCRKAQADADADVSFSKEGPPKAADQINDGIEQCHCPPRFRQHCNRIEGAAKEGHRHDDQHGNHLQLLPILRPDPHDETKELGRASCRERVCQ